MFVLFLRIARRAGVYSDRMATEILRSLDPLVVVLDRFGAFGIAGIAQVALIVAHDETALYAEVVAPLLEIFQISWVLGLIHEEDVNVFDAIDIEIFFRDFGEIEVVHLAGFESAV